MKKLITEQNIKRDRKSGLFLIVLFLVVAVLSIGRVIIANHLVEASERLRAMDKNIQEAKDVNQQLSEQLRSPQSLIQIQVKAESLGFLKTNKIVFLQPAPDVALLQ